MGRGVENIDELGIALSKPDPAIRYWAAVGLAALGENARPAEKVLFEALNDRSPCVRIAAAEALSNLGNVEEAIHVLEEGLTDEDPHVKMLAVETLVVLGDKAKPAAPQIEQLIIESEELGDLGWYMREAATWLISTFE